MSEKSTVYECVDREHDAWRCRACGYIENFEADGPTENGWHFCPGCGREIIVEAVNPCPFDNDNCMCQFCETPCNNGLNCSDCAHEGKRCMMCFSARALTGAWSSTQKIGNGSRWRSWEAGRNERSRPRKSPAVYIHGGRQGERKHHARWGR